MEGALRFCWFAVRLSCADTVQVRQVTGNRLSKRVEITFSPYSGLSSQKSPLTSQTHKLLGKLMRAVAVVIGFQKRQSHCSAFDVHFFSE